MTDVPSPPLPDELSGPKLPRDVTGYRYYAGYSRSFVRDILRLLPEEALVLDPWNGSGTTTTVAAESRLDCVGVDLNPAMVVIARAALLSDEDVEVIRHQASELRTLRSTKARLDADDPLLEWLDRASVARVRALQVTVIGLPRLGLSDIASLGAVSAFWLTALFQIVRRATKAWESSNPTWVKSRQGKPAAKLFWRSMTREMCDLAASAVAVAPAGGLSSRVVLGSSTDLTQLGIEPDLVLGSPPYCTRIDYAVATRVELSVLGMAVPEQLALRRELLGTTTVPPSLSTGASEVGDSARRLLDKIYNHRSKASRTYYWKWFAQYIDGYAASLFQLANVASRSGMIGLVVQDSYYKEVHIDLARITVDILALHGWTHDRSYSFPVRRSFAQINPRAVAYRDGKQPREQALFFRSI